MKAYAVEDHLPDIRPFFYEDGDSGYWLTQDWRIRLDRAIWTIRAGFDFDGASIPKPLWGIIGHPVEPTIIGAALLHDIFYCVHVTPKAYADSAFLEIMQIYGRGAVNRGLCWSAVASVGNFVWPKKQAEIEKYLPFISRELI